MIRMKGMLQSREKMKRMIIPTISKIYCSPYEAVLMVRRRPNVVNGGGLAVVDSGQRVVFKVDGCVVVGKKQEELTLRDGEGNALLLMTKTKGTTMEALSMTRRWKGFAHNDFHNLVFTLKEPNSCFSIRNSYEIRGDFQERRCSIVNSTGDVIAQIDAIKEVEEVMRSCRDLYNVRINPGIDQACIFGVIAVLDYIYDKST